MDPYKNEKSNFIIYFSQLCTPLTQSPDSDDVDIAALALADAPPLTSASAAEPPPLAWGS